jgi:hypothetical protein
MAVTATGCTNQLAVHGATNSGQTSVLCAAIKETFRSSNRLMSHRQRLPADKEGKHYVV